jgi:hypothetical protein
MNLVEAEATGPIEGDDEIVTAPRPPHRRVSVSLLFTLTVLTATVVLIYVTVPARHNVLLTEAIEQHRDDSQSWEIKNVTLGELRTWAIGVFGDEAPMPKDGAVILGARRLDVLDREAALISLTIGDDRVTYMMQHARSNHYDKDRTEGDAHAVAWRQGRYDCVAVGPDTTRARWMAGFGR